jgi:hypothetical protein
MSNGAKEVLSPWKRFIKEYKICGQIKNQYDNSFSFGAKIIDDDLSFERINSD